MVLMSERYLELLQHLEGEQLLSQVVSTFNDDRQQPPVRKVTVRRSFSDPPAGHGPGGKVNPVRTINYGQNHLATVRTINYSDSTYRTFSSQGSFRATADGSSGSRLKVVGA